MQPKLETKVFNVEKFKGAVAQSVEQRTENPCVGGSIPPHTTLNITNNLVMFFFIFVAQPTKMKKNLAINIKIWMLFILSIIYLPGCHSLSEKELDDNQAAIKLNSQNKSINIILILADDYGYEIPTYTGGQSYQTPNIDALAASGMQFTQCRAMPLCSPSRFEILTGKYNFRNYLEDSWGSLDPNEETIATMLRRRGYNTCTAGKWQLNGGDASIKSLGFDDYSVTLPYLSDDSLEELKPLFYKNPNVYQDGGFLDESLTKNKYGEDINRSYLFSFITSHKNDKFFAYWTPNLVHKPFCPTPDNPEFANWQPKVSGSSSDSIFFPSMVAYLDKEIGMLKDTLTKLKLIDNTLILFVGDNGTTKDITSIFKGQPFTGDKDNSTEAGIHVPLIASLPSVIMPASIDNSLIDFSDFFVTIADIAGVKNLSIYDTLDGVSFASNLIGKKRQTRQWSYFYYMDNRRKKEEIDITRWVQDSMYKTYKTETGTYEFYNFITDPKEKMLISESQMTPDQLLKFNQQKSVLNSYP